MIRRKWLSTPPRANKLISGPYVRALLWAGRWPAGRTLPPPAVRTLLILNVFIFSVSHTTVPKLESISPTMLCPFFFFSFFFLFCRFIIYIIVYICNIDMHTSMGGVVFFQLKNLRESKIKSRGHGAQHVPSTGIFNWSKRRGEKKATIKQRQKTTISIDGAY